MIITIDGPTASGKSTLAKEIAKRLNIYYLNTGFLYRGLSYVLVKKLDYNEENLKNPDQKDLDYVLDPNKFIYHYENGNVQLTFDGQDITSFLKTYEIDKYSSIVSVNPNVRKSLLSFQRNVGLQKDLVIEGRDTGSVVFPNADLKIFLTAPVEIRAKRWQKDMQSKGKNYSLDEAMEIVSNRDCRDKERVISPLVIPKDAIVIDSSSLTINQLVDQVISLGHLG